MTEFGYFEQGKWIERKTKRFVLLMRYHKNMRADQPSLATVLGTSDDFDALFGAAKGIYPFMTGFCDTLEIIDKEKSVFFIVE